ncbi:uncharacterized protein LOC119589704 [Penaeus monodon]|uniref:uncharacterized protein LOC119589704 n=1 Tax=Penaeus monodon TaxID=6687 RepID=UPI0018A70A51|nr:uncharacterized protein LOC119589704 [Penaeus monodon]
MYDQNTHPNTTKARPEHLPTARKNVRLTFLVNGSSTVLNRSSGPKPAGRSLLLRQAIDQRPSEIVPPRQKPYSLICNVSRCPLRPQERDLYVYNALNQVSLWGPQGQITDYAVKQWAGQVSDYLLPRWDKFGRALVDCLAEEKAFDQLAFGEDLFKTVEEPFTKNVNRTFSSEPIGDSVEIALRLHAKYRPIYDAKFLGYLEMRYRQLLKREEWMKKKKEGKIRKGMMKKTKGKRKKGKEMKRKREEMLDSWRENSVKAFEE